MPKDRVRRASPQNHLNGIGKGEGPDKPELLRDLCGAGIAEQTIQPIFEIDQMSCQISGDEDCQHHRKQYFIADYKITTSNSLGLVFHSRH